MISKEKIIFRFGAFLYDTRPENKVLPTAFRKPFLNSILIAIYHEAINSSRLEKLALAVFKLNWHEQGWKCKERVENSVSHGDVFEFPIVATN